jgi:hypothetical protein
MTTTIRLQVVEFTKSIASKIYTYSLGLIFICGLLPVILDDENYIYGKIFIGVLLVWVIAGFLIKKPYQKNSFLTINKNEFLYEKENQIDKYPIKDISNLTFKYDGYGGQPLSISGTLYATGRENELKFEYNGQQVKFNIEIGYNHLGLLRKVFKELEFNGKPVSVINNWGKKRNI